MAPGASDQTAPERPCEAVVDLRALAHNFALAGHAAGGRDLYPVIKADAYGHGAVPVARALAQAGADRFAVFSVKEAAELRAGGIDATILVLAGAETAAEADAVVGLDLVTTVHDFVDAERLAKAAAAFGRTVRCHVEVDTGMRRMGVAQRSAVALMRQVCALNRLELEGAFTHFACADEADPQTSLDQIERFRVVLSDAASDGIRPRVLHTHNSAALLAGDPLADAFPEATAARPGLMLYGVAQDVERVGRVDLRPVMTVSASLVAVREVEPGDAVGYGATHRFDRATRVGTVALGYADGVPVSLGNVGRVHMGRSVHPMVGRVSMDSFGIDLAGIRPAVTKADAKGGKGNEKAKDAKPGQGADAQVGDRVVFFGDGLGYETRVEAQAARAGTIPYEMLVRIGARVPRRYVGDR